MSYTPTQDDIALLRQRTKELYTRINLLNKEFKTIDSLEGVVTDGSYTVSSNSDIRRTFTCNAVMDPKSNISAYNVYDWLNKYLRIFVGIKDIRTQEIHWYGLGLYIITQHGFKYDSSSHTLSLSCSDLVGLLNDTTAGQLTGLATEIKTGRDIRQSIIETLKLMNINKYMVDYWVRTVPYDLEFGTGATVWTILTTLRDLYYPFEMFFDDDTFVCREIPSCKDDPVVLNHEIIDPLVVSENVAIDETEVRNCTEVWGASVESDWYSAKVSFSENNYTLTYDDSLTDFEVKSGKKFSFVVPEVNNKGCTVTIQQGGNSYGPFVIYEGMDKDGNDIPVSAGRMYKGKYYVIKCYKDEAKNLRMQFLGQSQVHAMVILSDKPLTGDALEQAKKDEACDVLEYVSTNDPSDTTGMYESPFSIEKIGRRNRIYSGGDYDNIYTDDLALQRAEYENWKSCRLTDAISVEMIMIPWLDVNKKVGYTVRSGRVGEKHEPAEYIVKEISMSLGTGTMSVSMQRFYPYYPYIIKK